MRELPAPTSNLSRRPSKACKKSEAWSRRVPNRIALMEDLPVGLQARAERPLSIDQILPVEVNPRAQPIRSQTGGKFPTVSFELPEAVASSSSEPLQQHRPFSHSRLYTPLPKAQHPKQSMFSGPSAIGVSTTIGMYQDRMQSFLRERREHIARADLPWNVPPGSIPSEAGVSVLEQLTTPLPPISTVRLRRPVQTTTIAVPGVSGRALAPAPLHPSAPPPLPAAPAMSAQRQATKKAKSPPPSDPISN